MAPVSPEVVLALLGPGSGRAASLVQRYQLGRAYQ